MKSTKSPKKTARDNPNKEIIRDAARSIIQAAKRRKNRTARDVYCIKYQQAKTSETMYRDLMQAALLYTEAAVIGEKMDSCIKDFASIIHQMGQTEIAVKFLEDIRPYYRGDLKKFDRLLITLERQLQPSGKHLCKRLLFEMREKVEPTS